ncbi:hypothetical protein HMPREF0262_01012 [Clostridium sp. ATCC 29733]|nr:hypothetical protein HMPREF0262_01012 [Clostridium sp. ATCC 29733]
MGHQKPPPLSSAGRAGVPPGQMGQKTGAAHPLSPVCGTRPAARLGPFRRF